VPLVLLTGCLWPRSGRVVDDLGAGDGAEPREESFVYRRTKLDLLFVIDDSCSMAANQATFASELPGLVDELAAADLDWRAGFVTATALAGFGGELLEVDGERWVDDDTPGADSFLVSFASVGTGGSGEAGLDAAYTALELKVEAENDGFVRNGSQVAVVLASDEDDYASDLQPTEFIEWLDAYRDAPEDTSFTAVVCVEFVAPACSLAGAGIGQTYMEVAEATGGGVLALNESLAPLGPGIASVHARLAEFELGVEAAPETLEVEVTPPDGEPLLLEPAQWSYDPVANVVRFDQGYTPPDKASVTIRYLPVWLAEELAE
jgi:hypothetical protein